MDEGRGRLSESIPGGQWAVGSGQWAVESNDN